MFSLSLTIVQAFNSRKSNLFTRSYVYLLPTGLRPRMFAALNSIASEDLFAGTEFRSRQRAVRVYTL